MEDERIDAIHRGLRGFVDEHREFLIINAGPFYVQFAGVYEPIKPGAAPIERYIECGPLYSEAVSDSFLEPEVQIRESGALRLAKLGWQSPPDEKSPNWHREYSLENEADLLAVARSAAETFLEGFLTTEFPTFEMGPQIDLRR